MDLMIQSNLPFKKIGQGKVRDIYDLGEHLLLVASDRISCFDHVLPDPVPYKGAVLTQISNFWFGMMSDVQNHIIATKFKEFPAELQKHSELKGRAVVVKKCKPIPVECVVRGYLSGSAWKEYKEAKSVCDIRLPQGLMESDKLPEPIFTPATKAKSGHDENVQFSYVVERLGKKMAMQLRSASLEIYRKAADYAHERGIIIADTKFEFGTDADGELVWIDEALTPDSSRFWPLDSYAPGKAQFSYDKQYARDYLIEIGWNKEPPVPHLSKEVIKGTSEKYLMAYEKLTGKKLNEKEF